MGDIIVCVEKEGDEVVFDYICKFDCLDLISFVFL